ncbi:hypothetical protein KEM09_16145 [Carboxylicivirga mesophila]|uniref:Uncharacterized protein n=2 Tax=Carboxylicivirga TaxID=1628153 RepID=A0A941IXR5_9BACT|nr:MULTISPECIES: hypothetical protein [Carboxylicivirga]MBR8535679.1 hypothetical protein [Carboxylicivirga sediminis]MBS2212951.1 hypothetical protein [Carboxylicivirga mesophila]
MAKKAKRQQQKAISREQALRRKHRATFLLNDKEKDAVSVYCKKYKIGNRSKFMREAVMRVVMEQFLDDYPTLFEKQDLDRLISD